MLESGLDAKFKDRTGLELDLKLFRLTFRRSKTNAHVLLPITIKVINKNNMLIDYYNND